MNFHKYFARQSIFISTYSEESDRTDAPPLSGAKPVKHKNYFINVKNFTNFIMIFSNLLIHHYVFNY
ncbi:MAG: hypothetical protein UZ08_BCD001003034 [Candidatus Parvibacillus calidus]|nr:MAG: hypothetical protein UZ08_BCD001003034 [Candidatus Parvibacillus calidus]